MSIALDPAVVKKFEAFYTHYCPQDLPILHVVLSSYHGREDVLFNKLKGKYGEWPVEGVPEFLSSREPSVASAPRGSVKGSVPTTPKSPAGQPPPSPIPSIARQGSQPRVSQPPSRAPSIPKAPSVASVGRASVPGSASGDPPAPPSAHGGSVAPASVPGTPVPASLGSRKGSAAGSVGAASAASRALPENVPSAAAQSQPPVEQVSRVPSARSMEQPPRTPSVRESVPRAVTPQQSMRSVPQTPVMSRVPSMVSAQQTVQPQPTPQQAPEKDWKGIAEGLQEELDALTTKLQQKERELHDANTRAHTVPRNSKSSKEAEAAKRELREKNAVIEKNEELLRIKERQIQDLMGRVDRQQHVDPVAVRSGPDAKTQQLIQAAYNELSVAKDAVREKDTLISDLERQLEEARAAILSATKMGYEHDVKLLQAKNALQSIVGKKDKKEKKERKEKTPAKSPASPGQGLTPYAVHNMTSSVLDAAETPKVRHHDWTTPRGGSAARRLSPSRRNVFEGRVMTPG